MTLSRLWTMLTSDQCYFGILFRTYGFKNLTRTFNKPSSVVQCLTNCLKKMQMEDIQTYFVYPAIHLQVLEHVIFTLLMRKGRHRRVTSMGLNERRVSPPREVSKSLGGSVFSPRYMPPCSSRDRRYLRIECFCLYSSQATIVDGSLLNFLAISGMETRLKATESVTDLE